MAWGLYERGGQRKYLTGAERRAFLKAAQKAEPAVLTLCWLLRDTGCRLSEAIGVTVRHVDLSGKLVAFETLKKRERGVFRMVPVSPSLLAKLNDVHGIHAAQAAGDDLDRPLWPWCRMTAYRRVKEVMDRAGIIGVPASPKGLRHGFGVAALEAGVPLNLVQRWLGHADLKTTAIYANAIGAEERNLARRMWKNAR
ncbi:MAG: site-specific integrase [Planctomycetes bacterium]|nr:site-specific integrase [Planctomycetota bacterium]